MLRVDVAGADVAGMDAAAWGVLAGGVALIALVLWYFFGEREAARGKPR